MSRSSTPSFCATFARVVLLLSLGTAFGCASSESTRDTAAEQAAAVGAWQYRVLGVSVLDEGIIEISKHEQVLWALIRDKQWGHFRARVRVHGSRMEINLDELRISGHIEEEEYFATLRRRSWDVRSSRRLNTGRSLSRSVSLVARRLAGIGPDIDTGVLECQSILRETDDC